jgi:hypothetical protein
MAETSWPKQKERRRHADQRERDGEQNQEGFPQTFELGRHDHEHKQYREGQNHFEVSERFRHAGGFPRRGEETSRRSL